MNQLAKLVSSVEENQIWLLKEVLAIDQISDFKIPTKFLAGALVIAAENRSVECFNIILEYNKIISDKIPLQYINAAFEMIGDRYGAATNCSSYYYN